MKLRKRDIEESIYYYGWYTGIGLIVFVTLFDVLWSGIRGFLEYNIGVRGILLIWLGLFLMLAGGRDSR